MESPKRVLGIEGGGTKTEWLFVAVEAGQQRVLGRGTLPASNLHLTSDEALARLFSVLPRDPTHVGIFLAGCGTEEDRARLQELATAAWPHAKLVLGSDRESGMATAFEDADGIVVISGTGAVVHGRRGGRTEKAGGWGQVLGDRGGGYNIALQGLRQVLTDFDLNQKITPLGEEILRMLGLNRLQNLDGWARQADKMSVARLAPAVFRAAKHGDAEMLATVQAGASILAEYARAVAQRLDWPDANVKLIGGMFVHHEEYAALFKHRLSVLLPGARVETCRESGALGAAWLAERMVTILLPPLVTSVPADHAELATAATEQRNSRSANLETLTTPELVELFIAEEDYVTQALAACREPLTAAVNLVSEAMREGGRLFYVGAGTSGRLGVLDASEIPPTFGVPAELVQGIMAGGITALYRAVEGAEDRPAAGALAVLDRGVRSGDIVCGLTASGRTPYVLGALTRARELGARTVLVTCNPARRAEQGWDAEIDLPTGAELVTGSTRLKAGTATKLTLNILSTCAMIRLGRVRGNSMVDLNISNEKLRDRGARLVSESLGIPYAEARKRLESADWNVRRCLDASPSS